MRPTHVVDEALSTRLFNTVTHSIGLHQYRSALSWLNGSLYRSTKNSPISLPVIEENKYDLPFMHKKCYRKERSMKNHLVKECCLMGEIKTSTMLEASPELSMSPRCEAPFRSRSTGTLAMMYSAIVSVADVKFLPKLSKLLKCHMFNAVYPHRITDKMHQPLRRRFSLISDDYQR